MTDDRMRARPLVAWDRTVIYEAHVRGMTMSSESVPSELRGTYAGFAHASVIDHLLALGVTTVELLPVHAHTTEPVLAARGLTNYWGYNTVDYFAPHAGYAATDDPITEFRDMVDVLHEAGLEVLLDAVYNHTAIGAVDRSWYRNEEGELVDFSGCGNTLDTSRTEVQDFILDSLRFWANDLGVDGFRFDLASALARDAEHQIDLPGALFTRIAEDPDLGTLKHVLEPWDATGDGYALGKFGMPFAEWNDRFRDDLRDFWRAANDDLGLLASRMAGSSDLFQSPLQSVNLVTAHDGFSLRDVVSYDRKHNGENGEDGRDGADDNRSDNCGVEGETDDPVIIGRRQSRAANLLASLLVARGVPMLRMGDEFGHTQKGNNNAYCQDNELSWMPWRADEGWDFRQLIAQLVDIRQAFNGADFLHDHNVDWLRADAESMSPDDWHDPELTGLGMTLRGGAWWMDTADQTMWIGQSNLTGRVTPLGLIP
ncbi:MAG: alpha-amylase family glycosyl hydrolase [Actinomycetota bacterium]|nr:alpha-amylase family glycosyl hydrolase [Actinomycetota bacterium]